MLKLDKAIEERRSVRKFDSSQPVTREQVDHLLHAAMLAPSACNTRPWEFIAVTNRDILDEIAEVHPYAKMCQTATAAIVVVALPQEGRAKGFYPQDCAAATQNILTEAASIGLGACWCGVYPREDRVPVIATLFNIYAPKIPFCVIALGVPAEQNEQKGFFEKSKVTYFE